MIFWIVNKLSKTIMMGRTFNSDLQRGELQEAKDLRQEQEQKPNTLKM